MTKLGHQRARGRFTRVDSHHMVTTGWDTPGVRYGVTYACVSWGTGRHQDCLGLANAWNANDDRACRCTCHETTKPGRYLQAVVRFACAVSGKSRAELADADLLYLTFHLSAHRLAKRERTKTLP